jgi:hypothetical protein
VNDFRVWVESRVEEVLVGAQTGTRGEAWAEERRELRKVEGRPPKDVGSTAPASGLLSLDRGLTLQLE